MKKGSYRRSFFWMLTFFGLPVAAFTVMFLEVSHWSDPRWGPAAISEKSLGAAYRNTSMILAAAGIIPYLGLLLRLWERLQLTDKSLRQKSLFSNRKVMWDDVIECRDLLSHIQLVPARAYSQIYIDYYVTFSRHGQLWRLVRRKCREVEANTMVGRRGVRAVACDWGIAPTLAFTAISAVVLLLFRQRIVLLGILSGMVLTLLSAWLWLTTRHNPHRWRSGGYIYHTLFALSLILPPAYFAEEIRRRGLMSLGIFAAFYLLGLLAGSGVISALLPSRKRS